MSNRTDWNTPALCQDMLAAAVKHLSKQQITQMADEVRAMGGWEFSSSGF